MNTEIKKELDCIRSVLDSIRDQMAWMIMAEQRFQKGERVEWTDKARKQGFPTRKKAMRGTVKGTDGFCVIVKLDGLKKEKRFHHAFFNGVSGPKLF